MVPFSFRCTSRSDCASIQKIRIFKMSKPHLNQFLEFQHCWVRIPRWLFLLFDNCKFVVHRFLVFKISSFISKVLCEAFSRTPFRHAEGATSSSQEASRPVMMLARRLVEKMWCDAISSGEAFGENRRFNKKQVARYRFTSLSDIDIWCFCTARAFVVACILIRNSAVSRILLIAERNISLGQHLRSCFGTKHDSTFEMSRFWNLNESLGSRES